MTMNQAKDRMMEPMIPKMTLGVGEMALGLRDLCWWGVAGS